MYQSKLLISKLLTSLLAIITLSQFFCLKLQAEQITEENHLIIIQAELQETDLYELPASVTVISDEDIERNNAEHLTELLNLAPNVNFSTGASRGRFIQIRGIGERSQFIEPVNPSVGVILDGIDLTGIPLAATTLDVKQLEILRGPQGTLYGANALAGLINVTSHNPRDTFYTKITAGIEEYDGRSVFATVSNTTANGLGYRFSLGHYQTDGYINNTFLNRDDTNNIQESSFKAKFNYQANEKTQIDTTLLFVDIDNGYDAFNFDNDRTTESDQPGHDRQQTRAASWKIDHQINSDYQLITTLSFADSSVEYGFDEDWAHPGICDGIPNCVPYSSFDNYQRDNDNQSMDILLRSQVKQQPVKWALGFYAKNQQEALNRDYTFEPDFISQFDTQNRALYGQAIFKLSQQLKLTSGLRYETRAMKYFDNNSVNYQADDNFIGGNLALSYQANKREIFYGLISRGYKAGGVNADPRLNQQQQLFDAEYLWNYEIGYKNFLAQHALNIQAAIFYQQRKDTQVKQSLVLSRDGGTPIEQGGLAPFEFIDYLVNAPQTDNIGLELAVNWQPLESLKLYSSLGYQEARFKEFFSFTHVLANTDENNPQPYDLSGRQLAHAPQYQLVFGANIYLDENWSLNPEFQAKDDFFLSHRHEVKANDYEIFNLRLTYQGLDWRLSLYANNLTDKDIQTRGFGSFGNDPRNGYATEPYNQLGAPRVVGVSFSKQFK